MNTLGIRQVSKTSVSHCPTIHSPSNVHALRRAELLPNLEDITLPHAIKTPEHRAKSTHRKSQFQPKTQEREMAEMTNENQRNENFNQGQTLSPPTQRKQTLHRRDSSKTIHSPNSPNMAQSNSTATRQKRKSEVARKNPSEAASKRAKEAPLKIPVHVEVHAPSTHAPTPPLHYANFYQSSLMSLDDSNHISMPYVNPTNFHPSSLTPLDAAIHSPSHPHPLTPQNSFDFRSAQNTAFHSGLLTQVDPLRGNQSYAPFYNPSPHPTRFTNTIHGVTTGKPRPSRPPHPPAHPVNTNPSTPPRKLSGVMSTRPSRQL